MFAERVTPRTSRITWCCTCDREIGKAMEPEEDIGPYHHLTTHPDHYVIDVVGEMHVWRVD